MASKTITYADSLFFNALLAKIEGATSMVEIATFLFRTDYVSETRAQQIADALKAAAARGVQVTVVLSYSRFETDVCESNYATAAELMAGGCYVKLAPRNRTMHTKLAIIDLVDVFIGSHNLTRGALSFNNELTVYSSIRNMRARAARYFNALWDASTPFAESEPPTAMEAVHIEVVTTIPTETGVDLAFTVNHTDGVAAVAAVAAPSATLAGAPLPVPPPRQFRVVAVDTMGGEAASEVVEVA